MAKIQLIDRFPEVAKRSGELKQIVNVNVVKGHINKLMFSFPEGAISISDIKRSHISVKHIGKRVTNLITKLPFEVFYDISNEKNGSVIGMPSDIANLSVQYAKQGGKDPIFNKIFSQWTGGERVAVLVDLGSFMLEDGDELHCSFERYARSNHVLPSLQVFSVSDDEAEAYNMITYDVDRDLNELHRNVRELYIQDQNVYQSGRDLDIYVDSPSNQYQTTDVGAMTYAMLNGKFEGQNPGIYKIWENAIAEDVSVKIIGATAGEIGIISVRVITNFDKYEKQQREVLLKQASIVEKLENNEPETASVMQAGGIIPSSVELSVKAEEFRS